ncbi:MAG: DNA primase [Myxococcota bacterium]
MIPDEKIAEIRERTDLVALVGEYVPLKRAGASFKGLCPFHAEKTPSFQVHPARQFFHCFGCKASGDAFAFLMRVEGRPFPDVARTLAERAGVELPVADAAEEARHRRERQRVDRLAALMEAAAGFYVDALHRHPLGGMAREEIERRGMHDDTVRQFRLGYAPHGWDALGRFLRDQGWSPQDAEEVGLLVPRRGRDGHYDRFRHRLVFPVADVHGRIVAFSGRQLDPPPGEELRGDAPAKYVNSPEGPLYKKGQVLFGLHEGRVELRRLGWAIVCEGNFDLLALHQAGFQNAVAPMGTSLTESHAKLLRRFAERVVLLFDGDAAGRRAVRAAFPLLSTAGLAARVVVLPPGADPDSFLREHGEAALRAKVEAAPDVLEFLIDDAADEAAGDPRAKADGIASLASLLKTVDNPVERHVYVERVAKRFGIHDIDVVRRQLNRGLRRGRPTPRDDATRRNRVNRDDAVHQTRQAPPPPALECELLGAILDHPELIQSEEGKNLGELLTSPDLRAIFEITCRMVETRGAVEAQALADATSPGAAREWLERRLVETKHDDPVQAREVLQIGIPRLTEMQVQRERRRLAEQALRARREGNDARAEELERKRDALLRQASQLRRSSQIGKQGTER